MTDEKQLDEWIAEATKAGVMAFTRCAAMEAAAHNVRINAVSPSIAMHEFLASIMGKANAANLIDGNPNRWHIEERVTVGTIGGLGLSLGDFFRMQAAHGAAAASLPSVSVQ